MYCCSSKVKIKPSHNKYVYVYNTHTCAAASEIISILCHLFIQTNIALHGKGPNIICAQIYVYIVYSIIPS